jgi:hypothetical protein
MQAAKKVMSEGCGHQYGEIYIRAYSSQVFWLFNRCDGVIVACPFKLKLIFYGASSDTNLSARCFNLVLRQVKLHSKSMKKYS